MSKCANCYGYGRIPFGGSRGNMTPYNSRDCSVCGGDGIWPKEREAGAHDDLDAIDKRLGIGVHRSSGEGTSTNSGGGFGIGTILFVGLLIWGYHALGFQ